MKTFGDTSFTWQGRNLKSITEGSNTSSYVYNSDGIRTKKTVNGTATEYFLNGEQILAQTTGDSTIWFFYDSEGNRVGLIKNGAAYYYMYNVQGDVVGLARATTGKIVATYEYDAWGNCSITNASGYTIGDENPFRYRGYYWDEESGLYYLNSRYYNPEVGRFISADGEISGVGGEILGYNLFAYCQNNPVNMSDPDGNWPKWATKVAIGVGAVLVGAAIVAATAATGGMAAAFVSAAVTGLKAAAVAGAVGATVGGAKAAIKHYKSTGSLKKSSKTILKGARDGFANGVMTGGIMAGSSQAISGVFKVAAKLGVPTGRNGGLAISEHIRALSPNHINGFESGGTLLKIGSKYKNVRFDVGDKSLFHMNVQLAKKANYHVPIGIFGSGFIGGGFDD